MRAWLRALERFGVAVCAAFGLEGIASQQGTGVFVGGRKLMSIGVAIRSWINLHGIAINVDMDLRPFAAIRPCDPRTSFNCSRNDTTSEPGERPHWT